MRYALINLGCKVNRSESDEFESLLESRSWSKDSIDNADIILINTCTVTGEAERKTRKCVNRALSKSNAQKIILTGCSVAIDPDSYRSLDSRIEVIAKHRMIDELSRIVESVVPLSDIKVPQGLPIIPKHSRVDVKIQDGCGNACTYCIVHIARGSSISKDPNDVLKICKNLNSKGIREIILAGIDLGRYDSNGYRLPALLRALLKEIGSNPGHSTRIRISSIEPQSIDNELIELLSGSNGKICRHLHIPLQSGSSKVLSEMNRSYSADEYLDLITTLRKAVPNISITTDVIAGFPGESKLDFNETLELSRLCGFSKMHVFPYSMRAGTQAAARVDQVDSETKLYRAKMLRELSDELRIENFNARKHDKESVVVEMRGQGMSESYFELRIPEDHDKGDMVDIVLGETEMIR